MESPTGIIPEELMYPQKLGEVMLLLQSTPGGSNEKLAVFRGWAHTVGVKLSASQVNAVARTGDDYQ
jgi:hypothetical protein